MSSYDDIRITPGTIVDGRWKVLEKLGQGGFGAVYSTLDTENKFRGLKALKVESLKSPDHVLKLEVQVMRGVHDSYGTHSQHVCFLVACGKTKLYNYMVMTLLGHSISKLRKQRPSGKFSLTTTVMIVAQCLQCLKDIHKDGWVHRDVKPNNFAIGHESDNKRTIFIFDYGLSRKFSKKAKPRDVAGFRGTLRYASLNAHSGRELGRQDDLLSLIYTMAEIYHGILPWKELEDRDACATSKTNNIKTLVAPFSPGIHKCYVKLTFLDYLDDPDYTFFDDSLNKIVSRSKQKESLYDWEPPKVNRSSNSTGQSANSTKRGSPPKNTVNDQQTITIAPANQTGVLPAPAPKTNQKHDNQKNT